MAKWQLDIFIRGALNLLNTRQHLCTSCVAIASSRHTHTHTGTLCAHRHTLRTLIYLIERHSLGHLEREYKTTSFVQADITFRLSRAVAKYAQTGTGTYTEHVLPLLPLPLLLPGLTCKRRQAGSAWQHFIKFCAKVLLKQIRATATCSR